MFDRFRARTSSSSRNGGDPILWQHLFWVFGHPEVYILILPAMGIVSEVLPTFSRKPLFGYPFVVFSGIFIGFMGLGVWSHHMFTVGLGPVADSFFALTTMLIAIPTGVKIFNWIGTMWGGSLNLKTSMCSPSASSRCSSSAASPASCTLAAAPTRSRTTPTSSSRTSTTCCSAARSSASSPGIYYWFPKLTGRMLERDAWASGTSGWS